MPAITCRDIVRRALRKLSRFAAGAAPDGDSLTDGIETLQSIMDEMIENGVFGQLYDVIVTDATYDALPQQRVVCNRMGGVAVNLPQFITENLLNTSGRGCYDYGFSDYCGTLPTKPRDLACIQVNDEFSGTSGSWIFNAKSGRWVEAHDLSVNSNSPLGGRYAEGLAAMLAERMASEYGMQTPPEVSRAATEAKYTLTHRNAVVRDTQYAPERYY
jgi:hypothetical protein